MHFKGPRSTSGPRRVPRRGRRSTRHRYRLSGNRSSASAAYVMCQHVLVPGPFPTPGEICLWNHPLASCFLSFSPAPRPCCAEVGIEIRRGAMASVRSALGGMPRKTALLSSYNPSIPRPRTYLSLSPPLSSSSLRSSIETLISTPRFRQAPAQRRHLAAMSTQASHPALLIPGPIEFDDAVLQSMSHFR